MAARRRRKIINIASIGGLIAYPGSIAYLASKGGVVQLTKGFAVELASYNVQVNAIAPSLFETPMSASTRSDEESHKYFMERTPAGQKGKPGGNYRRRHLSGGRRFKHGDRPYLSGRWWLLGGLSGHLTRIYESKELTDRLQTQRARW